MKNVIITGANGFIGSSLIKKLVVKGVNVVAIDISFKTPNIYPTSQTHSYFYFQVPHHKQRQSIQDCPS